MAGNARGIRGTLAYAPEATWGTTPVGDLTKFFFVSEAMALTRNTFASQSLRPDRNVPGLTYGNKRAGGDINGELFFSQWDDFIASVMFNNWRTLGVAGAAVTGVTSGIAGACDFTFAGDQSANLNVGATLQISGSTGNDGDYTITAVAFTTSTVVSVAEAVPSAVADGTGFSMSIINGVTQKSLYFERALTDITTPSYMFYNGMVGNSMNFSVAPDSIITNSFNFMGLTETVSASPKSATYAATPATWSTVPMDSFSGSFLENGAASNVVTRFDISITNNLTESLVIGSDLTYAINEEVFQVTGQIDTLFDSDTLYQKFVNGTETALRITMAEGGSGANTDNRYIMTMPKVKYTGGTAQIGGPGVINNAMPFQATYSATEGCTLIIDKLAST